MKLVVDFLMFELVIWKNNDAAYCIVMDLINAFSGNSYENMVQQATVDEPVFSVSSALNLVLVTDQWTCSLKSYMCFLCSLRQATVEQRSYAIRM
jgi:hypothetical protein